MAQNTRHAVEGIGSGRWTGSSQNVLRKVVYVLITSQALGGTGEDVTQSTQGGYSQDAFAGTQRKQYGKRVSELCEYAAEETVVINRLSIHDFWQFVDALATPHELGIVTTYTGNLRAVWEHGESFFAAEFLGKDLCEWVMWSPVTAPSSDRCKIEGLQSVFDRAVNEAE